MPTDYRYLVKQLRKRPKPVIPPVVPDEEPPKYNLDTAAEGVKPFDPNDIAAIMPKVATRTMQKIQPAAPIGAGAGAGAIGAGMQQQQRQMRAAPPPPDEGAAPPPDEGGFDPKTGMGSPDQPHNQPPPEDTSGTEDTPEMKKLKEIETAYGEGKPIEDWKESEEQEAAEKLAREQDAMKARMGGTDNPYAMLGGIAAQGEFLKRKGDINAKDVEMWFKQQEAQSNLLIQMENWTRATKPDVYNEFKPRMNAAFGEGYSFDPSTGTMTYGDGTIKEWNDLSQSERGLLNDWKNASGYDAAAAAAAPPPISETEVYSAISIFDPDLDNPDDYGLDKNGKEIALSQKIWEWVRKNKKIPTKQEVIRMYNEADITLEGSNLEDGDPNSPAW